jgi:hypothetical protein
MGSPTTSISRTNSDKASRRFDPYSPSSPKKGKKPRSQRTVSQSESDIVTYNGSDAYPYPPYSAYPYNGGTYPSYMQYPIAPGATGEAEAQPHAGPYPYGMGGYYWPGYAGPQGMIEGAEEEEEHDEKGEVERGASAI